VYVQSLTRGLVGDMKFTFASFPLDSNDPIKVHAFGLEPRFEGLARIGSELGEHFSFDHVDQYPLGPGGPSTLHALRESLRALACQASECVLREVAWHENSCA